jgi:four helix bundle protein
MHNFKNIIAWQKARVLVKDTYLVTNKFPKEELYGLTSQVRRSVVSIASNIAEGSGRNSDRDFARFLDMAIASSFELETQLILGLDLNYILLDELTSINEKVIEVQKLIYGFQKTLNTN